MKSATMKFLINHLVTVAVQVFESSVNAICLTDNIATQSFLILCVNALIKIMSFVHLCTQWAARIVKTQGQKMGTKQNNLYSVYFKNDTIIYNKCIVELIIE